MSKWKGQIEGDDILMKITVHENKLIVCLLDGTEIECEIE